MKKIINITACLFLLFSYSCSTKLDNYPAPSDTLKGAITDMNTGKPFQTEEPNGTRIELLEISWSSNPIPIYFWTHGDGTFIDTKIFSGTYIVSPVDGAFYPITGDTVKIKGVTTVTTVNFTVEPFLNVNLLNMSEEGKNVIVTYEITRSQNNYKILSRATFVSETDFVSNGSYDLNFSKITDLSKVPDSLILNHPVSDTITGLQSGYTYYIRVGARSKDPISQRYNYAPFQAITIK